MRGEVLTPGDDGYDEACRSGTAPTTAGGRRSSSACTGAADVIAAVGFARSNDLPIAVRGGGHSIAGFSTCDGGIVIDLVADERRPRRPGGPPRDRRRRRRLGRRRPRDPGPRPRHDRRARLHHRRRRLHARRRHRLADAQVRPRLRQPRRAPTSSPPTAGSSTRARPRTPTSSGACAAAAATSASSRSSSSTLHPLGPMSTRARSSTRPTPPATCCGCSATGRRRARRRSRRVVNLTTAPPLPVIPEEWHGKKVAALIAVSTGPLEEGEALVRRSARSPSRSPTCSARCRTR